MIIFVNYDKEKDTDNPNLLKLVTKNNYLKYFFNSFSLIIFLFVLIEIFVDYLKKSPLIKGRYKIMKNKMKKLDSENNQ